MGLWRVQGGIEYRPDSNGVMESFWDGEGFAVEARQFWTEFGGVEGSGW